MRCLSEGLGSWLYSCSIGTAIMMVVRFYLGAQHDDHVSLGKDLDGA